MSRLSFHRVIKWSFLNSGKIRKLARFQNHNPMVDKNLVKDVISKGNMLVLVPCVARILYSFFFLNLMLSCPWLYLLETLIIKACIYLSFFGFSMNISNCPEAFCKYAPQRVLSFEFMQEHLQTTASITFCNKITIFYTFYVFCNFLPDLWYHIWHLEAFHSFTMVNWKSLNFSCKRFFFLQTLWYHFFIDQFF